MLRHQYMSYARFDDVITYSSSFIRRGSRKNIWGHPTGLREIEEPSGELRRQENRCVKGADWGEVGVPSPADYRVWGASWSPLAGSGQSPSARNAFWRISKATECFLFICLPMPAFSLSHLNAVLKYFLNYATPQNILFHIPELKDTSPF